MKKVTEAGLNGAGNSTDCMEILTGECEYNVHNNRINKTLSNTLCTYSLTMNRRKIFLHSTQGRPVRWSDQTMVRFDVFVSGIWDGTVLNDVEFKLYTCNQDGHDITTEYQCGSVICDNGYLKWLVTVSPLKVGNTEDEI